MSVATIVYLEPLGDIIGGGQRSLMDVVAHLDRQRFRPVVVCGTPGTLVEQLRARDITTTVIPMPTLRAPWAPASRAALVRLEALLQQERAAMIHANQLRLALYALRAARCRAVPVLFHARVPRYRTYPDRWVDQYLARRCRLIVAVSEAVAARFPWIAGTTRLQVVYNGIDLSAFAQPVDRAVLRRRFGLADDAPLIGAVGLLEPRRGYQMLVAAMPRVLEERPDAHLLIVGREAIGYQGYRETLRRLAVRHGVSQHVTFTGFLDAIPLVMGSLTVCAVPGIRAEGFGRIVVEAGAIGCPVIATPLGGLRELVDDGVTGLLVPPQDPAALAQAILRLINGPALARRLGDAAQQRVAARFALSVMLQQLHRIYDEVIRAPALVA